MNQTQEQVKQSSARRAGGIMSRKGKLFILVIVGLLGLVALFPTIWTLIWGIPGRLDFLLCHSLYEEVVQQVKLHPPTSEATKVLTIDGIPAYYVRDAANHYTITLKTADWGHAGMAGYVYSDLPLKVDLLGEVDAPGTTEWTLKEQVAPHWWAVRGRE